MLMHEAAPLPEHLFPRDPWRLVESRFTEDFRVRDETLFALANGFLGQRGTHEEGRPVESAGTFLSGFHETWPIIHAEEAYGLARLGQTLINVPDATILKLYVDDEPLYLPTARLPRYQRVLDMRAGTLSREVEWATAAGKHVLVRTERLVSLQDRHVAAICYEVTVDHDAPVVINSQVLNREDAAPEDEVPPSTVADPRLGRILGHRVLERRLADATDDRISLGYQAAHSKMTLGMSVDHVVETSCPHHVDVEVDDDLATFTVTAEAQPGQPIRIYKFVAYQTSRSVPAPELVGRCRRTLDRVVEGGYERLRRAQRENLDQFWDRADVQVSARNDTETLQQAVHWNLFQLAQATWRTEGAGVPAKGLTGRGYDGHYFWDGEMYVLPFLAHTQPRIARNLLRFRHSMLDKARERAATLGHPGAVFPWRTINGEEASGNFQAGTAQYHLNADISYAVRRYVDARGDLEFLLEIGAEILVETARMWEDLGFYGEDDCFHIHGVTGPDEYTTVVNDNAYTNLMARLNLRCAVSSLRRLEDEEPEGYVALVLDLGVSPEEIAGWERAADAMFIPYDPDRGVNPQDDTFLEREVWDLEATPAENFPLLLNYHPLVIYRHQVLKQADVVMAMFLLGNEFTLDQKRRNFEYYDPLTTGDSSLSACIQSIVAAEIGDTEAADRYFDFALMIDLADAAGNVDAGVHVASAAGAWMALVYGFGGVRDFDGELTIDPRLPERWTELCFSLRFHDRQLRIRLGHELEVYELDEGDPIEVRIRGDVVTLSPGVPHELVLHPLSA